ncbi:MAG: DNA/RNA non-specific endonuclease [Phocaeicola sp.]
MRKYRLHQLALKLVLLTIILLVGYSCSTSNSDSPTITNEAYWKTSSTVNAAEGSIALILTGAQGTSWRAEVVEEDAWCAFSRSDFANSNTKTGTISGELNILYVYYLKNSGSEQRTAKINFQFEGEAVQTFDLKQLAESQENRPTFSSWPELPQEKIHANYQYATHYATLNNREVRNYSICFDKTNKAALWVAYPLHNAYLGGISRTDAWAFDPIISKSYQPDCTTKSYKGNYDRGHQLPSADRLATYELNAQTFYMSNLTPQLDRLNQDMWAKLETQVRNNRCSDTLYVVTGAHFGAGAGSTTDGVGSKVSLPTHYYKVLLRTKSGSSGKAIQDCSDSELISIGFWVEHKSYGNLPPPTTICTTVADIEAKTGFTFFPQVSAAVKQQKVPSQWGIN